MCMCDEQAGQSMDIVVNKRKKSRSRRQYDYAFEAFDGSDDADGFRRWHKR